ncbi:putative ABC-type spermidine/putescine transport system, binding component [Alteracholeplasma palmae J233]|uniref:Putative ABC-type spermidine/putescine transport system, binding component n=1 Tax=Alteracholeplasma palmae (strain ATCC 49389 / J233) TaxID=1318466 RepID=U4KL85_ALTPJ|nr:extracellular solute-binding protein [Alteracholeplasma palmae]CCV64659.1 putative ABC-type spermidine/putescine transport system, binding component [Alteracholeplasma palmae J233]
MNKYPKAALSDYGYKDYSKLKKVYKIISKILLGLIIFVMYLSILLIALQSLNSSSDVNSFKSLTFKWYLEMFSNRSLRNAITNTLIVSLVSTALAAILGTFIAVGIYSLAKKKRQRVMLFNNIPVLNADIVTGISLMIIFSLLLPIFPYIFGPVTLIMAHLFFTLPYVILSVLPKLKETDPNLMDAALDLGVKPYKALIKVVLPAIISGVFSGTLLAFTMSIDDFVISYYTTGNGFDNLSIWIYGSIGRKSLTPSVYAFSTLLTLVTLAFVLGYQLMLKKEVRKMLNTKKIYLLLTIIISSILLASCGQSNKLLLLNWGEYINDDLVAKFEEEFGVEVSISIADSNELFYSKIKSGTTAYDLVVPSDYMIEKMMEKDLLQEIDYSKLSNYNQDNNPYMEGVLGIQSKMTQGNERYNVPYFWGTFGLMYNKKKEGLEQAVKEYGWQAYMDPTKRPSNTRLGMYNVSRNAYAAAMYSQNLDPNVYSEELLKQAENTLIKANINEWGTDTLKKGIASNNLDLAFVYTGDFLDMLYLKLDDGSKLDEITFDIHIPEQTIAFMDAFVIPKKAKHVDLAHKFINFFLDPENAYENASVVGYATPLLKSYEMITNYVGEDEWLTDWAYANKTYYPILGSDSPVRFKGTPLKNLKQEELDKINNMVNKVKIS